MRITEEQYDAIYRRADEGDAITLQEAKDAVDWMRQEGVGKYWGMSKETWMENVSSILDAVMLSNE